MEEHPNVQAVRRLYDAFTARDAAAIAEAFTDTNYHVPGDNIIAGTYRGAEEILGLMARTAAETEGTLTLRLHDVVGDDTHVVALDRVTARRHGREIDLPRVLITHMNAGRPSDIWIVPEDQYAFDEFWT